MPGEIALIPMVESAYDPFAYSGAGAAGLWQLMPGTGTDFGLKIIPFRGGKPNEPPEIDRKFDAKFIN
jgi:membrane-bound lytic murein transglycosylase D